MAENLERYDLDDQDILDLEELKSELGSDAERCSLYSTGHFDSNPNSKPCSAPSTPLKVNPKLKFGLFDSEDSNIPLSLSDIQSVNMADLTEIKPLRASVSSYKSWVTRNLKQLNKVKDESNLTIAYFEMKSSMIKAELDKITDR